jgi:CRP-like cAMP-binding protein
VQNGNTVILPNSLLGMLAITKYSLPKDCSRFELTVTLDYAVPVERVLRVLLAGARAAAGSRAIREKPEARVLVRDVDLDRVRYLVRYYSRVTQVTPSSARSAVLQSILDHLAKAGLGPARSKEEVLCGRLPARNDDGASGPGRLALLKRVDFFQQSLQPWELERLAARIMPRFFRCGETLIRQGDEGRSLIVLAEGLVHASVAVAGGEPVRVAQVLPGEPFGEMSLLTGEPRSATVTAATDVLAFEIDKDERSALLQDRRALAESLSALVAERRLRSVRAVAEPPPERQQAERRTVGPQVRAKMRRFFGGAHERVPGE